MSVIVLVVGILVTGAGVVAIGFGIPINALNLGQTLIMAGTTALVGGLVLVGLAAAVSQLTRIAEALKPRPAATRPAQSKQKAEPPALEPRPVEARPPEPRAEPRVAEPRPPTPSTVQVSASAIERLRSTMTRPEKVVSETEEVPLSPNGGHQAPEPAPEPKSAEQPAARASTASVEAKEPRLDFLFRSRAARPAPPESFDALWPKRQARVSAGQPRIEEATRPAAAERPVADEAPPAAAPAVPADKRPAPEPAPAPTAAAEARSVAILKSGVVDGMAYTLYADGSIEAQLPHGTVRFGSIAELRAHIENNS